MVSSVLELIIVCGWCRPLQMVPSAYIFFSFLTDGVVRFGINNCLLTVSSLVDGSLCMFFSFISDCDVRT